MTLTCPKCNTGLPEQDGLEYRFCPRCGAEILEAEAQPVDGFQTIPPDFNEAVIPEHQGTPDRGPSTAHSDSPFDQTLEPEISSRDQKRPAIRPPAGPAPKSFFRTKKSPDK